MTTTYFYSYITTTSYSTIYTVTLTLKPRQNAYSVMGEIWVSEDGRNWKKIERGWDLYSGPVRWQPYGPCSGSPCDSWTPYWNSACGIDEYSKRWLENNCFDNRACLSEVGPPKIEGSNVIMVESGGQILYRITYVRAESNAIAQAGNSFWQYGKSVYCYCDGYWCYDDRCECLRCCGNLMPAVKEWGKKYVAQAIELVDWDTGEVYGSTNSTSFTFPVLRNTIVRFKYVKAESWSSEWRDQWGGPLSPKNCTEILNDRSKVGSSDWCDCARQYLPRGTWEGHCRPETCLTVKVEPCCLETSPSGFLDPWSPGNGEICVRIPEGSTATLWADWSASWGLKPGWEFDKVLKTGVHGDRANCGFTRYTPDSGYVSGRCSIVARAGGDYHVTMKVVFKRVR